MVIRSNTDISSIRLVLSEVAQKYGWSIGSLDIGTAFLYASMPEEEEELVFVKPPNLLLLFQLVAANVHWIARKAVYGLRQSPKQWGLYRDDEIKKMRFRIGKKVLKAIQSSIDVALWILVEDIDEDFDHKRKPMDIFQRM